MIGRSHRLILHSNKELTVLRRIAGVGRSDRASQYNGNYHQHDDPGCFSTGATCTACFGRLKEVIAAHNLRVFAEGGEQVIRRCESGRAYMYWNGITAFEVDTLLSNRGLKGICGILAISEWFVLHCVTEGNRIAWIRHAILQRQDIEMLALAFILLQMMEIDNPSVFNQLQLGKTIHKRCCMQITWNLHLGFLIFSRRARCHH